MTERMTSLLASLSIAMLPISYTEIALRKRCSSSRLVRHLVGAIVLLSLRPGMLDLLACLADSSLIASSSVVSAVRLIPILPCNMMLNGWEHQVVYRACFAINILLGGTELQELQCQPMMEGSALVLRAVSPLARILGLSATGRQLALTCCWWRCHY